MLALLVVAVVLFLIATIFFAVGGQRPQAIQAGGLALLALGLVVSVPPEPTPEPPDTVDYGGYRPHYQGHGVNTSAGRYGEIRRVSSADDLVNAVRARSGCVNTAQTCARIVIFDASGNYYVNNQLTIDSPYLTLAGQTAPNNGVTLVGARLLVDTHDVVVQHIRVRKPPRSLNACSIGEAGDGGDNSHVYNVVFDHVTCTWAEEVNNFLIAGPGSHDNALLDSFIAEGLWPNGWGGIGAGIGYKSTVARNIFSNHWSRQPIWGAPAELALYNNVSYNGTDSSHGNDTLPAFFGDADGEGNPAADEQTVIVNNVLIAGPDSGASRAILGISKKRVGQIYLSGNQGPGISSDQWTATICTGSYGTYSNVATCGTGSNMRTDTLFGWWSNYKFVVIPTSDVLTRVLANAGSRPNNRDSADVRMISDVMNKTGTHYLAPDFPQIPDISVVSRPCSLPSNPNELVGTRTRIEQYLESDATCGAQRLEVKE